MCGRVVVPLGGRSAWFLRVGGSLGMAMVEVPPRVAQAAAERQLGPLVTATKGSNPLANAAFALVVTLLLFGAMVLVGSLGWHGLRQAVIVLLALSLVGVFYTVVSLFNGFRRYYLFAGGIVRWQNGRITAFGWHEAVDVHRTRLRSIQTGFQFNLAAGMSIYVEAVGNTEDGAEFARQIEQAVTSAGVHTWG
jgi:hypothetical protein